MKKRFEKLLFEHLTPTREELNNVYNWGTRVIPKSLSSGVKKTIKSKNSCIINTSFLFVNYKN